MDMAHRGNYDDAVRELLDDYREVTALACEHRDNIDEIDDADDDLQEREADADYLRGKLDAANWRHKFLRDALLDICLGEDRGENVTASDGDLIATAKYIKEKRHRLGVELSTKTEEWATAVEMADEAVRQRDELHGKIDVLRDGLDDELVDWYNTSGPTDGNRINAIRRLRYAHAKQRGRVERLTAGHNVACKLASMTEKSIMGLPAHVRALNEAADLRELKEAVAAADRLRDAIDGYLVSDRNMSQLDDVTADAMRVSALKPNAAQKQLVNCRRELGDLRIGLRDALGYGGAEPCDATLLQQARWSAAAGTMYTVALDAVPEKFRGIKAINGARDLAAEIEAMAAAVVLPDGGGWVGIEAWGLLQRIQVATESDSFAGALRAMLKRTVTDITINVRHARVARDSDTLLVDISAGNNTGGVLVTKAIPWEDIDGAPPLYAKACGCDALRAGMNEQLSPWLGDVGPRTDAQLIQALGWALASRQRIAAQDGGWWRRAVCAALGVEHDPDATNGEIVEQIEVAPLAARDIVGVPLYNPTHVLDLLRAGIDAALYHPAAEEADSDAQRVRDVAEVVRAHRAALDNATSAGRSEAVPDHDVRNELLRELQRETESYTINDAVRRALFEAKKGPRSEAYVIGRHQAAAEMYRAAVRSMLVIQGKRPTLRSVQATVTAALRDLMTERGWPVPEIDVEGAGR